MIVLPIALTVLGVVGAVILGRTEPKQRTRLLLFRGATVTTGVGVAMLVGRLLPPSTVGLTSSLGTLAYLGGAAAIGSGLLLYGVRRYADGEDSDVTRFERSSDSVSTQHATLRRSVDDDGSVTRRTVGDDELPDEVGGGTENPADVATTGEAAVEQSVATEDASEDEAVEDTAVENDDVDGSFFTDK